MLARWISQYYVENLTYNGSLVWAESGGGWPARPLVLVFCARDCPGGQAAMAQFLQIPVKGQKLSRHKLFVKVMNPGR
jgi:hypothetical protein